MVQPFEGKSPDKHTPGPLGRLTWTKQIGGSSLLNIFDEQRGALMTLGRNSSMRESPVLPSSCQPHAGDSSIRKTTHILTTLSGSDKSVPFCTGCPRSHAQLLEATSHVAKETVAHGQLCVESGPCLAETQNGVSKHTAGRFSTWFKQIYPFSSEGIPLVCNKVLTFPERPKK